MNKALGLISVAAIAVAAMPSARSLGAPEAPP